MTPVLVDTSLWINHLRYGHSKLASLLIEGDAATHPMIIGELACGSIRNRTEILNLLKTLPIATEASHAEVLHFIGSHRLMGLGLGYVDMHILAASALSGYPIWTLDKTLGQAASKLSLRFA
jgi:hypothetical protein